MTKILEVVDGTFDGVKHIRLGENASTRMWNKFVEDMAWNNTYCPEISRVIYNIGTKAYPEVDDKGKRVKDENGKVKMTEAVKVLTTVVFFDDGTKVTVTNSEHDGVQFVEVPVSKEPNAPKVVVADEASKENGLVYAIAKRMIGYADEKGTIVGDGFGRKLRAVVKGAYDTAFEDVANKYKNKVAKEKYEASKGKGRPRRPSFAETVVDFRNAVDALQQIIANAKNA